MTTYSDILAELEKFFKICRDLGLQRQTEEGRFGAYRSRIEQLIIKINQVRNRATELELAADLRLYLVALAESQEIAKILPFLHERPPDELLPRMRSLLAGPELPSEEDPASNQARNIQFELWLATILWQVGLQVELAEPDIRCKLGEETVLFACKRLFSVRKLTRRINEAKDQLRRSVDHVSQTAAWGFIAISLSRVLGRLDQSEAIANRPEGLERLASRIEGLVTRRAKWHQTREAQGVVFHAASIFTNAETDRIETGKFLTLYGDGSVCQALAAKFQNAAETY